MERTLGWFSNGLVCSYYVALSGCSLLTRLLTSAFILVNGIVFSRSNGLMIKCLIACLMN